MESKRNKEDVIEIGNNATLLDRFPDGLPSGIIDKKITGIGATHCEIESKRNSIIVMPTQALAASKAVKHNVHYFGGNNELTQRSPVEDILAELKSEDKFVTILVVADSFIRLTNELGDNLQKFHITFDEIDSFQSESFYRPKLEDCLDIYLDLLDKTPDKLTMVTATWRSSTIGKLRRQKTLTILNNEDKKNLFVVNTTEPIKKATEIILDILERKSKEEKIIVAFDSIDGIITMLGLLREHGVTDVGVLSSARSQKKVPEGKFAQLLESKLENEITFITSAYFTGVDIDERAYTIIVIDQRIHTSKIIAPKINQILGRARGGNAEQYLVFQHTDKKNETAVEYVTKINNRIKGVKGSITYWSNVCQNDGYDEFSKGNLINTCETNIDKGVSFFRFDEKTRTAKKNKLCLDYLMLLWIAEDAFSTKEKTVENLSKYFNVEYSTSVDSLTDEETKTVILTKQEHKHQRLEEVKELLFKEEAQTFGFPSEVNKKSLVNDNLIELIKTFNQLNLNSEQKEIVRASIYQMLDEMAKTESKINLSKLKRYLRQLRYLLLGENTPIRKSALEIFNEARYTGKELEQKIKKFAKLMYKDRTLNNDLRKRASFAIKKGIRVNSATIFLGNFYTISKSSRIPDSKEFYKKVSLKGFEFEPKKTPKFSL